MLVTDKIKCKQYYQALVDKDKTFVGIFYAGVKTTGVFCIATCRARKPKPENVAFYTTLKEPLLNGYRPCKICNPTENANEPPPQVKKAIALLKEHPKEKISDFKLKENGLSTERIRRWFKKHYGMTFHAYQRMFRINTAFQELKNGNSVTGSAFESGYESLSGFGYTFKKIVGKSPKEGLKKNIIVISRITTPLGPMFACATAEGLCLLEFVDRRMLETELKDLQRLLNAVIIAGENEHIKQAKTELAEYFSGHRKAFGVQLHTPGTAFQQRVWDNLKQIPYAQTRSYQEQASKIGNPKAVRAVASANGFNRIAIIIPCHRVIGKDGSLTGYGGGLERKKWLLTHEKKNIYTQVPAEKLVTEE